MSLKQLSISNLLAFTSGSLFGLGLWTFEYYDYSDKSNLQRSLFPYKYPYQFAFGGGFLGLGFSILYHTFSYNSMNF